VFRTLTDSRDVGTLVLEDLSDWFMPHLPHFMREAMRSGGEVTVSSTNGTIDGVFLFHPSEHVGSIFSRSQAIAQAFFLLRDGLSVYSEVDLGPPAEVYRIYSVDLGRWEPDRPIAHPVRPATPSDIPRVRAVLLGVYGLADDRWFATMPSTIEQWFLAELDKEVAGVACATIVGRYGRLHSLAVVPTRRHLGVGSDLVRARLLWLRAAGAHSALSEISERNRPSQTVAERSGMRAAGRLFRYERPRLEPEPPAPPH
jgi:GNAT superfamily N-acetyltransferase